MSFHGHYGPPSWTALDLTELSSELTDLERERDADCDVCDGYGEVKRNCQTCEGTGWFGPADIACTDCEGHGTVQATCVNCDGTGTHPSEHFDPERFAELSDLDSEVGGLHRLAENEPSAIPEHGFEDYARDLAEDIGAIGEDAAWPANRIDWEAAASDLQMDYMSFDFEGTTYWVRSY